MKKEKKIKKWPLLLVIPILIICFIGCVQEPVDSLNESQIIAVAENTVLILELNNSYSNITEALEVIHEGQTPLIGPGVYTKPIILEKSITMKAADPLDRPVFLLESRNYSRVMITINASHCTLEHIIVKGTGFSNQDNITTGILIQSSNNEIEQVDIYQFFYGLRLQVYTNDNSITQSRFTNNTDGIELIFSLSNTITNNIFENNTRFGLYVGYHAQYNQIQDNVFNMNHEAIRLYGSSQNTVSSNDLYKNTYGIEECCGAIGNTIKNNRIRQ